MTRWHWALAAAVLVVGACALDVDKFNFTGGGGGAGAAGSGGGNIAGGGTGGCTQAPDCPGEDTDCQTITCNAGTCGVEYAPVNTPCAENGGDVCDGQGNCVDGGCLDGQHNGDETDEDCGGACPPCENGNGCEVGDDCQSGFCDSLTCAPCGGHDDCAGTQYCDGGVCQPRKTEGADCGESDECQSGHCVDDVCCDGACSGLCRACRASLTSSADGVCDDIDAGTDPHNECSNSSCNGNGGCTTPSKPLGDSCSSNSECQSNHCVDDVCCDGACDGTCEACKADWTPSPDGTCDDVDVNTDPDGDCPTECNGNGGCFVPKGVGPPCVYSGQCSSGFCVDEHCCEVACDGLCERCDGYFTSGAPGECSFSIQHSDPDMECEPTNQCCDGNGACGGSSPCI